MAIFAYGVVSYLIFFGAFLYLCGFVEGFVVPRGINDGPEAGLAIAVVTNLALIGLFALQHTIMARPKFKHWFTRIVPKPIERSTFVLVTSLIFILMFWQWRAMPHVVWQISDPLASRALLAVSLSGWLLALYATFLIDHFDLFGLRQVWMHFRGIAYTPPRFRQPLLYRLIRNPLMLGFLIAFWAAPTMTYGRLLFAAAMTGYILMGIRFEERDLSMHHGPAYDQYRASTPMLLPFPRGKGQIRGVEVSGAGD